MGLFSFISNLYENMRSTKSNLKSNKIAKRNYNFEDDIKFSGNRKEDLKILNNEKIKKESKVDKTFDEKE